MVLSHQWNGLEIFPSQVEMNLELPCKNHSFKISGQRVKIISWLCSCSKMNIDPWFGIWWTIQSGCNATYPQHLNISCVHLIGLQCLSTIDLDGCQLLDLSSGNFKLCSSTNSSIYNSFMSSSKLDLVTMIPCGHSFTHDFHL